MRDRDDLERELQSLRERMTQLCAATLSINESLDIETVLQGVVDSARALTGSKYGVLTTLKESDLPQDFVTSGMSEEHHRVIDNPTPERVGLYKLLSGLREPLRISDFNDYASSMGLTDVLPFPVSSFLTAPMLHAGEAVGNIHLAKQEPGEDYTKEDVETLVMFASQAALVISNARRHREEQRARSDLEILIDTTPVGVAVFDARTGEPVSSNREALRIARALLEPGQAPEELLSTMTVRRSDGRVFALAELPIAEALSVGETLRLEEVVFQVPDGRSVTILLNATPILSAEGEVESFVVTFQDLSHLEELERQRAEFLGVVSHELRAPLSSIKGSAATLIESGTSLDPAETDLFYRIIEQQADEMSRLITDLLDSARIDAGTLSVALKPANPTSLVDQARNTFLSGGGSHDIHIDLDADLPPVMADERRVVEVLGNLLANAARFSRDTSPITVGAAREGTHVAFYVADRGEGLSSDVLPHLFRKFSQFRSDSDRASSVGSGLGLAICKGIVEAHGGRIWAESDGPGRGATFTFTLPIATDGLNIERSALIAPPERSRRPEGTKTRVLVVDDDPQTLRYVRNILSKAGYAPIVTGDPGHVEELMVNERPHLVLLDLLLPGSDGIELMETIPELAEVPVIFLSAYGRDQIIARAFEAGATDYVVKPFSPTELVARIQTALRRQIVPEAEQPPEPYRFADLTVNYGERTVFRADAQLRLTDLEFRVLAELSLNAGRVLTHSALLLRVWGPEHRGHAGPLRTVVKNLRRKLGDDPRDPAYIQTEPRVGYRLPKPS